MVYWYLKDHHFNDILVQQNSTVKAHCYNMSLCYICTVELKQIVRLFSLMFLFSKSVVFLKYVQWYIQHEVTKSQKPSFAICIQKRSVKLWSKILYMLWVVKLFEFCFSLLVMYRFEIEELHVIRLTSNPPQLRALSLILRGVSLPNLHRELRCGGSNIRARRPWVHLGCVETEPM
jgi:hypothetical protein